MANPQPTPIRRRWLPRFGLRTLLITVTAVCVLLGAAMFWYRVHKSEHDRQLGIAQKLRLAGAEVRWRSSAPDWIIDSEYFRGSPSINQLQLFGILEFIEEVQCLPEADIDRVIDLLVELPRSSELSINVASLSPKVIARLATVSQLRELMVDHYRHPDWIDDVRYARLAEDLRDKLPGVEIQQVLGFHWTIDEATLPNESSTAQK